MNDILSDKVSFKLFSKHVSAEYSLENLMFVLLYTRIKYRIIKYNILSDKKNVGILFDMSEELLKEGMNNNEYELDDVKASLQDFFQFFRFSHIFSEFTTH